MNPGGKPNVTPASNGFAKGLIATALLFAGIAVTPCAADDQAQATDNIAVQLIQLLNENEALITEIATLRGQVEELIERSERSRESQLQIAADFDARLRTIEEKPEVDNSEDRARISALEDRLEQLEGVLTAMHEVVTTAAAQTPEQSVPQNLYESGLEKYQAGDYAGAIIDLQEHLQAHGNEPEAAGARYWLAEAQIREGEFDSAIATGEELLGDYPDSEIAPDTMFLLGKAHLEMGDAGAARRAWEELVFFHPDSGQAVKARDLLERLP